MNHDPFWTDKRVFITGASSGIGRGLALHLAARGARVGLIARRRDALEDVGREIASIAGGEPGRCALAVADVVDAEATRQAVQSLEAALGPCDLMIANAGIHRWTPGWDFRSADVDAVIQTNVCGVAHTFDAVLPGMIQRRRGHLVAVSSLAAKLGLPEVAAYSASKSAVVALIESLRVDLRPLGIRATVVCPGFVDTPMIEGMGDRRLERTLSVAQCCERIRRAIERNAVRAWFPRRLAWLLALVRCLPFRTWERVCKRLPKRSPTPPPE